MREILEILFSSGSRNFGGGWPTNMKSMPPLAVAIFFMTTFYRPRGGAMAPLAPPGSTTVFSCRISYGVIFCVSTLGTLQSKLRRVIQYKLSDYVRKNNVPSFLPKYS